MTYLLYWEILQYTILLIILKMLPFELMENVIHLNKILFCVSQPFQCEKRSFLLHQSLILVLRCTSEMKIDIIKKSLCSKIFIF